MKFNLDCGSTKEYRAMCIVSRVFWGVVPLLVLASSTAAEDINKLHHAGQIQRGTLLKNRKGFIFLAIENNEIVYFPKESCFLADFTFLLTMHVPLTPTEKGYTIFSPPANYNMDRSIALAKVLKNKRLPFALISCNEKDWMTYIITGKPKTSIVNKKCPLARSLINVNPKEITDNFQLYGGRNYKVNIADLDPYSPGEWDGGRASYWQKVQYGKTGKRWR